MNHIYRVVWNATTGFWQAVSEFASGRTKSTTSRTRRRQTAIALLAGAASGIAGAADLLPTHGQLVTGQASVAYAGKTMTVNQSSQKAVLDWSSFSIGQGHAVNFVQPSASSVALNRVLGADPSIIQGALNANGHVFLVNPNGVLFSPTAQVNVGGLLASTLSMGTDDFMAGRYQLAGKSAGTVANQGTINATAGGNIVLVAARVQNSGQIRAERGNVLLGAGSEVLVDFGGPVKLQVQKGAVDALVENGGAIRADGGKVLMTAKSADELTGSVINNTGIVQARTLATGKRGEILLLGDMQSGTLHAGGLLDASAPHGGNGGDIETSAAHVQTAPDLVVNAGAAAGKGGDWLVDPYDYTINLAAASTITGALNQGTNVTITTQSSNGTGVTGSGSGDITVSSPIAKTTGGDASLTLRADRNIVVGADVTSTSGRLNLTLSAGNAAGATTGGVNVNGNLSSNGGNILIGGANGSANGAIAYALNTSSSTPAITIGAGKAIDSAGGDVTINGRSLVGSNNGSYGGATAGVYIQSNATIRSGSGNLLINGESTGGIKTFGLAFQGGSNTVTTLASSTTGGTMLLNAVNATPGNYTSADLNAGAIGLVSYGSRAQVVFQGPSVAGWLVYVNGAPQLSAYTQAPQLSSCSAQLPNCGTMVVPGSNNSYLYATYQAVDMATRALFITQAGSGTKIYDGNTTTTGLTYSATTDIANFSVSNLVPAPAFATTSKNVGTYTKLVAASANPTNYTTGGTTYAVGYFNTGSFAITQKSLTPSAADKVYDGNTTAAVSVAGAIAGDAVTASGTGTFGAKDVGTYAVNISGITLGGADMGNYSLAGNSASATAQITARTVTLGGTKTYDGSAAFSSVMLGNVVAGEDLGVSGAIANSANAASARWISNMSLLNGVNGLASNYQLPGLGAASASNAVFITPKTLTLSGISATNKVYDGTTSATLSGGTLSGLVANETLNLGAIAGAFASKDVGTSKAVSLSAVSLTDGTGSASNYTFSQPAGITADITPKALTVSGITAASKVYDGSTAATVNTSNVVLTGLVAGDAVTVGATGAFADKNAGNGKNVILSSTHGGADAGNYVITDQASGTASITTKALSITGVSAANKIYDGGTAATLTGGTLSGLVGNETLALGALTGTFADKNADNGKIVVISGGQLGDGSGLAVNYSVTAPASVTAAITPKALSITGVSAVNKVYDGGTAATLTGGTLSGLVGNETLALSALTGTFADKNAGNGKTVAISGGQLGDGTGLAANYSVTAPASVTAAITPKALSITGVAAVNKVYDGSTEATLTGGTLSGLVGNETLALGALSGAFSDKNAVNGKTVAVSGGQLGDGSGLAANYSVTAPASVTAAITPKALSITGVSAVNKVYDGGTAATLTGGALSGLVGNETLTLGALTGTFADKNAGNGKTVAVSGGQLGDGSGLVANYSVNAPASVTAAITPKALSITGVSAANKIYDGSTAATLSGGTLSGLVGNETLALGALTGTFADKNAGNGKTVTVSGGQLGDGTGLAANYSVTAPASVTAAITPKALSITGISAANKIYDGSTAATLTGGALSGLVGNETLTLGALTGTFADKNAGNGKTVTVSGGQLGDGTGLAANYSVTAPASVTAAITPKALSITGVSAANKIYDGGTAATLTGGTLSGLVGNETLALGALSGAFSDKNAGNGKTVTVSGGQLGDGTGLAANYSVTAPASVTAAITPKALSITGVLASDKVYDGGTAATLSGGTLSGLVGNETLALGSLTGAFADKNAGNGKTVTVSGGQLGDGTGLAANYSVTAPASVTAAITPKALSITGVSAVNKVYDGGTAATLSGGTLSGLVGNETLALGALSGAFSDKNAGNGKTVAISAGQLGDGSGLAANYSVTAPASVTAAITPKALSITGVAAVNKVYDGGTAAALTGGTLSGLVGNETLALGALSGAFSDKNAGNGKTVTVSGGQLGDGTGLAANYSVNAPASVTAAITPKALSITGVSAVNKVYDGGTAAMLAGGTLSGLVGNETLALGALTGAFSDKNAGNGKTVTVSGGQLGDGSGLAANYSVNAPASVTAAITPKALSITGVSAVNKVYDGGTAATLTGGTLSGLVGNETLALGALSGAFSDKNAGNGKTVTVSGGQLGDGTGLAANYSVNAPASVTAAITPKALSITGVSAVNKVYDGGTAAALTGGTLSGLVGNETLALGSLTGAFADKNAGNRKTVAVSGGQLGDGSGLAANYSVTAPASVTAAITPKALSITGVMASDKVYDGGTAAALTGGTLSGLVGNETLALGALSGAFSDKNAGNGKTVTVSGGQLGDGTGLAANYSVNAPASVTAAITPKALSITGVSAANKIYDGGTAAMLTGGALSGLVGNETLALGALTGAFADKNAGNGKTVAISGGQLGDGSGLAANYSVTAPASVTAAITPKALSITGVSAVNKVYDGGTAATLTGGTLSGLVGNETLALGSLTGAFADKNAGNGKTVTVSGGQLGDGSGLAANYSVNAPASVTAAITPKLVTVNGLAVADKTADGTTAATITTPGTLAGLVANDALKLDATSASAKFAQSAPGIAIPVSVTGLTLTGADAGNYLIPASSSSAGRILTAPAQANSPATAATATITPQAVGIASSFAAPTVGGLAYVAVAEGTTTPQPASASAQTAMSEEAGASPAPVSTTRRRLASTQGAGANRDAKYLDVMVVSGGIRMPASASSDNNNAPAPNNL